MGPGRLATASLLIAVALAACRDRGPAESPASREPAATASIAAAGRDAASPAASAAAADHRVSIAGRITADAAESRFTLVADAAPGADGVLHVRAIEVDRGDPSLAVQRITGLATSTPWTADWHGFELVDMNFDGHLDMRLVEVRTAGPGLAYLNWLYEPASDRYVASPDLDALASPSFDAARREVVADWRDSATRYGTDSHRWQDGRLVPLRRESREYREPGVYDAIESRWSGSAWQQTRRRQGRDPS